MDDSFREILMSKVDKDSATVGIEIPDSMTVQGREIPLHKIVFDICSTEDVPEKYDMNVDEVKLMLRRERNNLISEIENDDDITKKKGEKNVNKINQINRALSFIKDADRDIDVEAEIKKSEAQSTKRWKNFLDKIKME
jgi:hypothetical protein